MPNTLRERLRVSAQLLWMTAAGVVALAVLVAAVVALPRSSTKSTAGTTGAISDYGPSSSSGAAGLGGTVPGAAPATTGGAAVGATAPGTSRTSAGSALIPTSTAPSRFVAAHAPGVTDKVIYIGLSYSSQAAAANRALGAAGAAQSYDARNVFNVVIDYANVHGGFAGRKLVPVYYDRSVTNDANSEDQATCAKFTQDNKVFVMAAGRDILDSCAERAGAVPFGSPTTNSATSKTYAQFPHLVDPWDASMDRLSAVTATGLYRAKYFTGKLGIVTWDDPTYHLALEKGYVPTLRRYNVPIAQSAYVAVPQSFGAVGDSAAAVSSVVAKFKSLGIDHVIIQDGPAGVFGSAGLTFEWMNQAKSQRYYPRYGENFNNAPGWSVLPSDQQDHLLAVDSNDLDKINDAGWHTNMTREQCYKMQAEAGYPVSSSNLNDELAAATACDVTFYVQRVVNSMSVITTAGFVDATQQLGTSLRSASVFGTKLFPGRRDGGGMSRTEEYFASCSCLKYLSPPQYPD
jgi:hypothetical protein